MRCPICKKSVEDPSSWRQTDAAGTRPTAPSFPFCSDRCKLIDLGRWLEGRYQVPVVEEDGGETALSEP